MVHIILHYDFCRNVRSFHIDYGPLYPNPRSSDPTLLPKVQIDRGAIRFLLSGAHMMCPGLTSKGGYLPPREAAVPEGAVVAIFAEGKEHAVGIGLTKLSSEEMKKVNKGVGVEVACYLGDDLWPLQKL
jgi:PUA domain protein